MRGPAYSRPITVAFLLDISTSLKVHYDAGIYHSHSTTRLQTYKGVSSDGAHEVKPSPSLGR